MVKKISFLFIITFLMILLSSQIFAVDTTEVNQLIDNAKAFDGKQVTLKGEAIGEPMQRGGYSWVNIKDNTNAIGIWMKLEEAQLIAYYGNYKNKGDSIKIVGVFHRACVEHGGEADIHCEVLTIENKGVSVSVKISGEKVISAGSLLLVLIMGIFIVYYFVIRKKAPIAEL